MSNKKNKAKSSAKRSNKTTVTVKKSTDTTVVDKPISTKKVQPAVGKPEAKQPANPKRERPKKGLLERLNHYFKESWRELKKVQWPNRKATWSLTIAVILFTAFFSVVILLIDIVFQELFNLILAR